ncbi:homocysteine S-methyltransferase [Centipeda periodontii DSM 2778]|uniref:S-methylmethionine:homocysteine methyltransferase n=1 Tax=Centipeda periodontii DSM 2778 TaxID=888060 RepID=F5RP14_9FIRM|nr:homocysteine S-methyltransferase [Centipeda periodontii]EGK58404.1 homocysteine S-methyltransferase [Centipeda periodontii DSM 2778]
MNVIEERLAVQDVIVLDGAFATEIEARGFSVNDALWSAKALFERPDLVREVHLDYLRAGADVVTSASYQATVEGFMKRGFSKEEAAALIQKSIQLAQEACDLYLAEREENGRVPFVAASVGPYGAYLADGSEYRGDYGIDEDALVAFHAERLALLASAQPDLLACETLPCLVEARAIVRVLREKKIRIPAWFSFSCRDAAHISDGMEIAVCARWLDTVPEAAAIGLNCTAPQYVESLIGEIRRETTKPIVVYPNSGETYDASDKSWHGAAEDFGTIARRWRTAGARLIGGCCRTTPREIADIAAWAKN